MVRTPVGHSGAILDPLDVAGLLALVAAGHDLALLPRRALGSLAGLPLAAASLVHRTELLRIGG